MVSARSYCGQSLLENLRVRVTLKRPSKERARQETAKWGGQSSNNNPENLPQKEQEDLDYEEASYSFVCKMLPHDLSDRAVSSTGEHLILRDSQVRRLCREKTVFQYEAEIFELVPKGHTGILTRPGFAANTNGKKK